MDGAVLLGFLKVIGISLVPVALFSLVLHARQIVERAVVVARRWHLLREPPAPALGPPLESLARDLRRLRPQARFPRAGMPMARQRGIEAAYDEKLVATARALAVATQLDEMPFGLNREAERLRLEHDLERAGFSWQLPPT